MFYWVQIMCKRLKISLLLLLKKKRLWLIVMVKTVQNVRSAFMIVLCATIPFPLFVAEHCFVSSNISLWFVHLVQWLVLNSSGGGNYLLFFPWPLNLAIKLNAPRYSPSSTPILVGKRLWQSKSKTEMENVIHTNWKKHTNTHIHTNETI